MADSNFIDGLIVKAPHENAPDFVKAKLSIKRQELIDWLQQQTGDWINADIKESRGGKWYAAIDNWKPDSNRASAPPGPQRSAPPPAEYDPPPADYDDDIPF
jgi:hypothetical protein